MVSAGLPFDEEEDKKKMEQEEIFRTERLTIRRIQEEDWQSVLDIWIAVGKTPWAAFDTPKDTAGEAVRQRIARWASCAVSREHMFFAACLHDIIIGYVSLNVREEGYELGYCFHPAYYGHGYGRESVGAVLGQLKDYGVKRVEAGTALQNLPSVRLLETLGFSLSGTEQVSFFRDAEGSPVFFEGGRFEKSL